MKRSNRIKVTILGLVMMVVGAPLLFSSVPASSTNEIPYNVEYSEMEAVTTDCWDSMSNEEKVIF